MANQMVYQTDANKSGLLYLALKEHFETEERHQQASYVRWHIRVKHEGKHYNVIFYNTGKVNVTPKPPEALQKFIVSIIGEYYTRTEGIEYYIGCDEAGKGELLGNIYVACVGIKASEFDKVRSRLSVIDTKARSRSAGYWAELLAEVEGTYKLNEQAITPAMLHAFDGTLNDLLDITYQFTLSAFEEIHRSTTLIVIDDYGVGQTLRTYLDQLPAQVQVKTHADATDLAVHLAAIAAKNAYATELAMLREDPRWQVDGLTFRTGNANDAETLKWLEAYCTRHDCIPPFVKRYATLQKLKPCGKKPYC